DWRITLPVRQLDDPGLRGAFAKPVVRGVTQIRNRKDGASFGQRLEGQLGKRHGNGSGGGTDSDEATTRRDTASQRGNRTCSGQCQEQDHEATEACRYAGAFEQ